MPLDLGLDDPAAKAALVRALRIVEEVVDTLHDQIGLMPYSDDCEIYRLARAFPEGQISFDRAIIVAAEGARDALDETSWILRNDAPRGPIVLHALLRAALVGSGRVLFTLFPSEPAVRFENARVLIAQEARGFTEALDRYSRFKHLSLMRPEALYLKRAKQQNSAIQGGRRPPGDGVVMVRAAETVAAALAALLEDPDHHRVLQEHVTWLWNTHSGGAHTHAWPRLLPRHCGDPRFPGDFAGDFLTIATIAHIAMRSFMSRWRSGSANTTSSVL